MEKEVKKVRKPRTALKKKEIESVKKDQDSSLYGCLVVPVRDIVMFPGTIISLFIGRVKSIKAVNAVLKKDRKLIFATQKDSNKEEVEEKDLPVIGTIGNILQCILLPDETIKLLVDCSNRVKIKKYYFSDTISADASIVFEGKIEETKAEAYFRSLISTYEIYSSLNKKIPSDAIKNISAAEDISVAVDIAASNLTITDDKKMAIINELDAEKRLSNVMKILLNEIEILKEEKIFQDKVRTQVEKNQKEYYLHEQMKLIKKDLGEVDDAGDAIAKYREALKRNPKLSKEALDRVEDELKKLRNTSPSSSEFGIIKSYLDLIFDLPWKKFTKDETNLKKAENELSKSHYGMEKVKERIIEHIAVQAKIKRQTGVVLCLYGPPGVGKTTLARSIARAMNREYVKISLGGLHDPSELFGHRKTYIGAMPGKIINAMKKAKTSNPLILLDEIDKMSSDHRGDPASVMLEILDPEQNQEFLDHYLDIGFDISNVLFVATANSLKIPGPLRDRMELINIPSYLEGEKLEIANKYLVPSKFSECGIDPEVVDFEIDAMKYVIDKYTRESGVRELERCIAKIARKNVVKLLGGRVDLDENPSEFTLTSDEYTPNDQKIVIKKEDIRSYLGIEKFSHSELENKDSIGVVNGLAYTSAGGDVLLIEAAKLSGKGAIKFTGSLGDVMKESIQAGYSYIRANAKKFGIDADFSKFDIHIHAPEGATPKDGPSAGITICIAIISILTDRPVRKDVAMTGEITLHGKVLAIGGLREKLTSAVRSGQITEVAIPYANIKDIEEIPQDIKAKLVIHPCKTLDDVIAISFRADKKIKKKKELSVKKNLVVIEKQETEEDKNDNLSLF